jgi:hypothetical protein
MSIVQERTDDDLTDAHCRVLPASESVHHDCMVILLLYVYE